MPKSLIRKNQLHPDIADLVSQYGTGIFASNDQLIQSQLAFITITGNQTISGIKNFIFRPTVNGSGVLLSGDKTIVYTTGNQSINGEKNFNDGIIISSQEGGYAKYTTPLDPGGDPYFRFDSSFNGSSRSLSIHPGYQYIIFDGGGPTLQLDGQSMYLQYGDGILGLNPEQSTISNNFSSYKLKSGVNGYIPIDYEVVYNTGNQTISGIKTFVVRPTVNGTGVLLSSDIPSLPTTIVYATGDQEVFGHKSFEKISNLQNAAFLVSGEGKHIEQYFNLNLNTSNSTYYSPKYRNSFVFLNILDTGVYSIYLPSVTGSYETDYIRYVVDQLPLNTGNFENLTGFSWEITGWPIHVDPYCPGCSGTEFPITGLNGINCEECFDNFLLLNSAGFVNNEFENNLSNSNIRIDFYTDRLINIITGLNTGYLTTGTVLTGSGNYTNYEQSILIYSLYPNSKDNISYIFRDGYWYLENEKIALTPESIPSHTHSINDILDFPMFTENIVYTTDDQTISGVKTFATRPQVNGTGVLLIGEEAKLPTTIVYTTGNQTISGVKTFATRPQVNGTGVLLIGEEAKLPTTIVYTTGNQNVSGIKTFEKIYLDSNLTLNNTGVFLKDRYDTIAELGDYGGGLLYNFEKGIVDIVPNTQFSKNPDLNFNIITGYSRNSIAKINQSGNVMITYGYNHYPTDTTSDKTYVRVYTKSNDQDSFKLKQTITGDYFTDFRGFGYSPYGPYFGAHVSTSADGNILAISELFSPSPYNNLLSSGAVYIYTGNTGNGWNFNKKIFTPISGKNLHSMEMSDNGDVFIVSNKDYFGDYFGQGIAYVYTGNTSHGWSLKQTLNNFNNQLMTGYYFGASMSIANSGQVFAIGVPNADNNSVDINGGAVVIYTGNKTNGWDISQRILGTGTDRFLGQLVKLNNDGDILATNWTSGWGANYSTVNGNINIYTGYQNKNYDLKQILDGYYLGSENNSTYAPSFGGKFEFANSGNTLITNHNAKIFKYNYLGNLQGVDWNIVSTFTGSKNSPYKFRNYISSYGNKYSFGDMNLDVQGVSENAKTLVVANHFGLNSADGVQFYIFNQTAYNNINFLQKPTVNTVPILIRTDLPKKEEIVDTISSQSISGNKNFVIQPTYRGEKLAVLSGNKIPASYIPSNINFNIKEIFLTTSGLSDKNKDYFSLENLYIGLSEFDLNLITSYPFYPYNKYIINVGAYNNTGNTIALRFDPTPPIGSQIIIKNYCPQDDLSIGLTGVSGIRVIIPKYTGQENENLNDNLINIPYGDFINLTTTSQEFSIIRGIDNNGVASFYKDNSQSEAYPNNNPSGFITGVDLSSYITKTVDLNNITNNFVFESGWNSKLLKINTATLITGVVPSGLPLGYNVAFAQMGDGALYITGSGLYPNQVKINQRNSFNKTAGKFAVASLLNYYTDQYLLYGDLA
jgi:hypothetical protein